MSSPPATLEHTAGKCANLISFAFWFSYTPSCFFSQAHCNHHLQHSLFPPQETPMTSWPEVSNDQLGCQVQEGERVTWTREQRKKAQRAAAGGCGERRPAGGAQGKAGSRWAWFLLRKSVKLGLGAGEAAALIQKLAGMQDSCSGSWILQLSRSNLLEKIKGVFALNWRPFPLLAGHGLSCLLSPYLETKTAACFLCSSPMHMSW